MTAKDSLTGDAFLGVERSVTGRRWVGPTLLEDRRAVAIAQSTGLPDLLCRVLARFDLPPGSEAAYLEPKLRDLMRDPSELFDMDAAATRFGSAARHRQRVAIFADYDVDGGSAAALLTCWLREFGVEPTVYVPDRISEGFGPNPEAMSLLARDHDLIVCVDCGTSSPEALKAADGTDVIVVDHHRGPDELPPAFAVVNPNRRDESGDLRHLCAAGVAYLFLVAANRVMRAEGLREPDLIPMLDLVALATVADVVPLVGLNRAFVRQGLEIMRRRARPGLVAIADISGLKGPPTASDLGFRIGPRINAGGRMERSKLGADLLKAADDQAAVDIARQLDDLNAERRRRADTVAEAAVAQAEGRGLDAPVVWAAGPGWYPGIVGIVAAQLVERSGRPSIVIGVKEGRGRGSGRSIPGVDLEAAIGQCLRERLLAKAGGHSMAVGLDVDESKIEPAMERLGAIVAEQAVSMDRANRDLRLDAQVSQDSITEETIESLERAGPYGAGAPEPKWALARQRVTFCKDFGNIVRLGLADGMGRKISAVAFPRPGNPLCGTLPKLLGETAHFAGTFEIDAYRGRRRPQFLIEDAAPAR